MTRAEAIKQIESLFEHCKAMMTSDEPVWSQDCEALKVALFALRGPTREQVEKVWGGCGWCDEEWGTCDPITNRFTMPPRGGIRFCPMCGKPLRDEAVEMVIDRMEGMENG